MKNKQITEVEFNEIMQGEEIYEFQDEIGYSLIGKRNAQVGKPQIFILLHQDQDSRSKQKTYYQLDSPTANHAFSIYLGYVAQEWSVEAHDHFEALMTQVEEHVIWCDEKRENAKPMHLSPEIFEEHRLAHTPNTPDMTNLF